MTRHLDPDRRRPAPTHPGFDPREIDVDMDICRWCGAHVPAAEAQRIKHEDWEQRITNRFAQLIERVAILEAANAQLSGMFAGRRAATDHLSGSGSRATALAGATAEPSPDPDVKSPPTPPQEATAGRGGAEGSNQGTDAAGLPSGGVTEAPDAPTSPGGSSGATKGSRPVAKPGEGATGRLHLVETEPTDRRMWT